MIKYKMYSEFINKFILILSYININLLVSSGYKILLIIIFNGYLNRVIKINLLIR